MAIKELQRQHEAHGSRWMAAVLDEVSEEYRAGNQHWIVLENMAIIIAQTMKLCAYMQGGKNIQASLIGTISSAATTPLLDAVAEWLLPTERMRTQRVQTHGAGPCYFMLDVLLQDPGHMRHMAQHPAFVEAVCWSLTLPEHLGSDERVMAWTDNAIEAMKLVACLTESSQEAADAIGGHAELMVPLLYDLLVPPRGR